MSTVGCAVGIFWGTIFTTEVDSLNSSLILILMFALGAGKFINLRNKSWILKFLSFISPMKYGTELILRVVLKGRNDEAMFLLNHLGLNEGQWHCEKMILLFSILFFMIGWAVMVYKARYL